MAEVKKEVPNQLTDEDGLDKACEAAHDISVIDNTLYIARTYLGNAND